MEERLTTESAAEAARRAAPTFRLPHLEARTKEEEDEDVDDLEDEDFDDDEDLEDEDDDDWEDEEEDEE